MSWRVKQAALDAGVSQSLLYKHIKEGLLKASKFGAAIVINDEDWQNYKLQAAGGVLAQHKEQQPCPQKPSTEPGRSTFKTRAQVSHGLDAILTPEKRQRSSSANSKQARTRDCSVDPNDTYSGRH